MYAEAKKLHITEELLKVESDAVLVELETVLSKSNSIKSKHKDFSEFVGKLSSDEIDELERNIKEGCEQINENDWK